MPTRGERLRIFTTTLTKDTPANSEVFQRKETGDSSLYYKGTPHSLLSVNYHKPLSVANYREK